MFGRVIISLSSLLLAGCAYNAGNSQVAPGSEVGGVGNIQYEHRDLGGNMHVVIVTVRPGLAETETSMSQRNQTFGTTFAAQTCPMGFEFVSPPEADRLAQDGLAQRTKTYTFRCRK